MKYKDLILDSKGRPLTGTFSDNAGDVSWCVEGKLHRIGEPALICSTGAYVYSFKGNTHRTDGIAVELKFFDFKAYYLLDLQISAATTLICLL